MVILDFIFVCFIVCLFGQYSANIEIVSEISKKKLHRSDSNWQSCEAPVLQTSKDLLLQSLCNMRRE